MTKSPKKQRLSVYLEPEVMKALSAHAARRGLDDLAAETLVQRHPAPDQRFRESMIRLANQSAHFNRDD